MDGGTLSLPGGVPGAGGVGGGGVGAVIGGSTLIMSRNKSNLYNMSTEVDDADDDLELVLGLSIGGGGLKIKEEASRMILTSQDLPTLKPSCSSSSSSSSVNIPTSSIVGSTNRTSIHSVSPPNATSVVGWPPIRKAHRVTLANHTKPEHEEFSSRPKTENITNGHHLTVKVNMDGTLIGRKVDLYAHTSYETLAQTLENMFYGSCSSRLLNETSEFVLTYEDKDGDCMLVGDVPWQMFLSSVKRLRILRNPKT